MPSLADILSAHGRREGSLLPILHDVQAAFGHISEDAIREIAQALNLTRAEVHGVVSFYHDFRTELDARPTIKICRAEACKARGVEALMPTVEGTAGERVRVETVYCLGLCSVGPAALVGQTVYARLSHETAAALVRAL